MNNRSDGSFRGTILVEVMGMVVCEVVEAASAMAAQALREFCLSVFFASVNSRYDCCFDETLFADDCYCRFFVDYVLGE